MLKVKEFLNQVRKEKDALDIYMKRRKMIEYETLYAGCRMGVGVSAQQKRKKSIQEAIIEKLEAEDLRVQKEHQRLLEDRRKAEEIISLEEDRRKRNILTRRYILAERWEDISCAMAYDLHYIFRLHGESLRNLEKRYKKIQKDTFSCGIM